MLAIVDTGPLYAAVDESDADHQQATATLARPDLTLVIPALVVAEVVCLIRTRLDSRVEAAFLRTLDGFDVIAPTPEDWGRIGDLVEQYADFPLGGVDASIIALAERLETDLIITLDQRHFRAVRPHHCAAFRLLPE